MNREELIKEYIIRGGRTFFILKIDKMRDGGTIVLLKNSMNKDSIYIHKNNLTFHSEYPPTDDNIISEKPSIEYIIHRMEEYLENCKNEIERTENLLNRIKENGHD